MDTSPYVSTGECSTWLAARLMAMPPAPLASLLAAVDQAHLSGPPEPTL